MKQDFEQFVRSITAEINGEYPRLWMTDCGNPDKTKVFIVGYNPARPYFTREIDFERYIDSLLYQKSNWLWHLLIKISRRRHVNYRESLHRREYESLKFGVVPPGI